MVKLKSAGALGIVAGILTFFSGLVNGIRLATVIERAFISMVIFGVCGLVAFWLAGERFSKLNKTIDKQASGWSEENTRMFPNANYPDYRRENATEETK